MNPRALLDARPCVTDLQRIDAICDRFEAAWSTGQTPDLASFLSEAPASVQPPLLGALLQIELEYRTQRGEQPDARSYHERYPAFRAIVAAAFGPDGEVSITTRRSDRSDWVSEPTALVAAASNSARVGAVPAAGVAPGEPPGLKVAGYEVFGELGRGGMGVVFKARQVALNRDVAVKLIRSGSFASQPEVVRFQSEAEAVAQLDHPHIVPIYEVGQYRGQHFFSMKLVTGTSLDKRLNEFAADPRAAATVVAVAAEAVHHAHQRGILHRDLKPANILLDERGEPYVTDFGLAKRIAAGSEVTHSGTLAGTPAYMSPEQATQAPGSLSTATDVYGLGTILYAALAGRAPFAATTVVETLDLVRTQSPESPSVLNARVPRDLEIICLKCLEKEPRRRYQSALELAQDLERWLKGVPILARPVGPLARAGMWCRRNKAMTTVAALLVLALIGGFAGITWKWREAVSENKKAEALREFLTTGLLAQASLELDPLGKDLPVQKLLDRASEGFGVWFDDQPEIQAKIHETIGGAYLSLGRTERAELHLKNASRLDNELHGPGHPDTLRVTNLLATLLDQTGHGAEAEPLIRRNQEDCRRNLGQDNPITLDAGARLGAILWHLGKWDQAETVLRKNVADRRRLLKAEHPDTLRSVYLLSRVLRAREQLAEAETFAYEYAHSVSCSMGINHPANVAALTNQGDVLRARGQLQQAEPYYRHAVVEARNIFGANHPSTLAVVKTHADVLSELGQPPAAP
jgi:eukaryotic-like serine/threonine-protein kinase